VGWLSCLGQPWPAFVRARTAFGAHFFLSLAMHTRAQCTRRVTSCKAARMHASTGWRPDHIGQPLANMHNCGPAEAGLEVICSRCLIWVHERRLWLNSSLHARTHTRTHARTRCSVPRRPRLTRSRMVPTLCCCVDSTQAQVRPRGIHCQHLPPLLDLHALAKSTLPCAARSTRHTHG
jgi:hypothetical protein